MDKMMKYMIYGMILRMCLMLYGLWQDKYFSVKYTDIDYIVFTDAARFVSDFKSPYLRHTYRYTPLLSYILLPNIYITELWGKIVFICGDMLVILLIQILSNPIKKNKLNDIIISIIWIFNPYTVTISSRGNCDSITASLVLYTLYLLKSNEIINAGLIWGLSVHWRIYPIIFTPSIFLYLFNKTYTELDSLRKRINLCFKFFISAFILFILLFIIFYILYGYDFVFNAYLYHLGRSDHRHNFSPYFYPIYFNKYTVIEELNMTVISSLSEKIAFPIQMILCTVISIKLYNNLSYCWFLLTIIFVTFNKVCTAQYFVWFFCLLPIVLINHHINYNKLIVPFICWIISQLNWLFWAWLLEFKGYSVYFHVWLSSCLFLLANVSLISSIINLNIT